MRGASKRTTKADQDAQRAPDPADRHFVAARPDQLWVVDFTYVATWSGFVYVAFCLDVFSRKIVGWRADTTMRTSPPLDALEMANWSRAQAGRSIDGLVHHSDAAPSTPRSDTPNVSPRPGRWPRSDRWATPTATPWPSR